MTSNLPKTRAEARLLSSKTYFTGKACVNGHLSERRVIGATCIECSVGGNKKQWAEKKDCPIRRAKRAEYKAENFEKILELKYHGGDA